MNNFKRLNIFTGNLGSGKTEVAANFALMLKEMGHETAIVDLDVVNPYFRTRLISDDLGRRGLRVISPGGRMAWADSPSFSPAIRGLIEDDATYGVFDVGGDDVGATALGGYSEFLAGRDYHLYFVVNPYRPYTRDVEGIGNILQSVEGACRMKVTGLVSNPTLGHATVPEEVFKGHRVVQAAAEEFGLPIAFLAARKDIELAVRAGLPPGFDVLPLEIFMRAPLEF